MTSSGQVQVNLLCVTHTCWPLWEVCVSCQNKHMTLPEQMTSLGQ